MLQVRSGHIHDIMLHTFLGGGAGTKAYIRVMMAMPRSLFRGVQVGGKVFGGGCGGCVDGMVASQQSLGKSWDVECATGSGPAYKYVFSCIFPPLS